jgi:hypothetical protein
MYYGSFIMYVEVPQETDAGIPCLAEFETFLCLCW